VELRHLEHFVAVAEQKHFTRAAEAMSISQSGLSASIRALERELHASLFIRNTRSVELTEAGRARDEPGSPWLWASGRLRTGLGAADHIRSPGACSPCIDEGVNQPRQPTAWMPQRPSLLQQNDARRPSIHSAAIIGTIVAQIGLRGRVKHTVIYLHGVGGGTPRECWLSPLNTGLLQSGFSTLDDATDNLVEPQYAHHLLASSPGESPAVTWKRPETVTYEKAKAQYMLRRADLERTARRHEQRPSGVNLGDVPRPASELLGHPVSRALADAHRYRTDRAGREAVWREVVRSLPAAGRVTIVAHSLGSVVALDVIKRLPVDLEVELLLTVGSPLSMDGLWRTTRDFAGEYPYDRLLSWVNVYDPRDPVTAGRGVGQRFPQALDLPVDLAGAHDVTGYCSHPVSPALLGHVLYRQTGQTAAMDTPAKSIGPNWQLQLLAFAFTNQLSRTCWPKKWEWKLRLDTAREISALRLMEEVAEKQASNADAVELENSPSRNDLLHHAADLVRDSWNDDELLAFCVSLFMSPPIPPFDVEVDDKHRQDALAALLNRVRRRSGSVTDTEYAKAVANAVDTGRAATGGRDVPWGALLGLGAVVLALTGVGLWAAVPVGLAGAATVTATLAAFGPGGMVGGMLTIAAATGAGTALIGAGATGSLTDRSAGQRWMFSVAGTLAHLEFHELRGVVAGMIAVVDAQARLGLISSGDQVYQILAATQAQVAADLCDHETVAPDRPGTKVWRKKADLIEQALAWLDEHGGQDEDRAAVRRAITSGPE
jgi:hypothetical protein